jgi:probable phosphoglycerate mutase
MAINSDQGIQFFVMRHAATVWNREGRIQGQSDSPLSPVGQQQIKTWQAHTALLMLDEILCSDLGRALATARGLNRSAGLPLTTDPRLREQDWGRWTGRVHRRLKDEDAATYARQTKRGWQFCPPAGESHLQVLERALAALADIAAGQAKRRILVVTHEGVLKCLIYHLAIRDGCGRPPATMAPYHLHHLVRFENRLYLKHMNAVDLSA